MHRILHIVPALNRSGTTSQLALLTAGLPGDEFEQHVVALNDGGPAADDFRRYGIEPVVIGHRWRFDPMAFLRLRQEIVRFQSDLVHTWEFESNTYGRLAAISVGTRKLVATELRIDRWKLDHELAIDRWLGRRTDQIVIHSQAVRDFYVAHGLPNDKFRQIPSAAYSIGTTNPTSREALLDELKLPADSKLIAYIGSLRPDKRLKEIIWAADQLQAVAMPAHLLIIGDGPQRQRLERYSWQNRVDERIHFLGCRDDVSRLLGHVDVLWQPSATEGHSQAILDAMAAGIPIVAAEAGGNRELITSGENGHLVPLDERAGFARWTLPLLEDSALAQRLGEAGRQRALKSHRPIDAVAGYAAIYRELLLV